MMTDPNVFSVSYAIVTPDSAEHGEAESRGFISVSVSLRDAIADLFETRTSMCDGFQSIDAQTHWIEVVNGMEFETGAYEERSLHIPDNVTESSRKRIAKICGAT